MQKQTEQQMDDKQSPAEIYKDFSRELKKIREKFYFEIQKIRADIDKRKIKEVREKLDI